MGTMTVVAPTDSARWSDGPAPPRAPARRGAVAFDGHAARLKVGQKSCVRIHGQSSGHAALTRASGTAARERSVAVAPGVRSMSRLSSSGRL